jgi:hypothetical protein
MTCAAESGVHPSRRDGDGCGQDGERRYPGRVNRVVAAVKGFTHGRGCRSEVRVPLPPLAGCNRDLKLLPMSDAKIETKVKMKNHPERAVVSPEGN